ncbi:MAG TPA: sulfotransferase, partial [candidate division Zixibacteria bacterium]|nr:sulfotransferase [candidate division Zixibacteria bacterium]
MILKSRKSRSNLPNFLIAGASKSGTTSLHSYLKQHPMIFMPVKESRFFVSEIFENLSPKDPRYEHIIKYTIFNYYDYVKLFENVNNEHAIGEAGTLYLYYYKIAISKIKKYLGNNKIIIILRNPTDRAFSAYMHLLRDR